MKLSAKKAQLTRQINQVKNELIELEQCKRRGWTLYLGDPINPQIRQIKRELEALTKKRENLNK